MKNPWLQLPKKKPYILKIDQHLVAEYNRNANSKNRIRSTLLPEPFVGNPRSDIILLNLNPGWSPRDSFFHRQKKFRQASRANLLHKKSEYPFHLLNPKLSSSLGYKWWDKRLQELIEDFGRRTVARKICCIEFAPYHSKYFKKFEKYLPSQEYNFHLVRQALENNAMIIVMRGWKYWQQAVPELNKYEKKYCLNSCQSTYLTKNNFEKEKQAYKILTTILKG